MRRAAIFLGGNFTPSDAGLVDLIWHSYEHPKLAEATALARDLSLPLSLAPLLCRQGLLDKKLAADFLSPKLKNLSDPFLLPDMAQAVDRIVKAVDAREKIVLYGDYDVDGVAALTMLRRMLAGYGCEVACFLPHRVEEGYGLSRDGLERCLAENQPQLLVAVDCGSSSAHEIADLQKSGIDVIVLDHHECSGEWPRCVAVVNPKRGTDFGYLCSGGLAFKMCHALLKTRPLPAFDLKSFLDLAALATVADLVPLAGENRLLVRHGLQRLAVTNWPGLRALIEVSSLSPPYRASDVGFRLGPRLNAAGRLGTAKTALDLLSTDDPVQAVELAAMLQKQNGERQILEKATWQEAVKLVSDPAATALVVASQEWSPGVVGIVASRLVRQFHRPSIVIAFDKNGLGKGSGRSIRGLSLVAALKSCASFLKKYGGHEMAAGLTIEESQLPGFTVALQKFVAAALAPEDFLPRLHLDAEIPLSDLDEEFLHAQGQFEPFGMDNPRPFFLLRKVSPDRPPVVMKEKHLRIVLRQGLTLHAAVFFGGNEKPLPPPPWDVAFRVEANHFRGETTLQIQIEHLRSAQP